MAQTDPETFRRAATGDADAITILLRTFGPQVRRRLVINPQWQAVLDVEDVMQVTYLEAFLRIRQLRTLDEATFVAWLTRVAENNLRDAVKELERDKRPDPRRRIQPTSPEDSFIALSEMVSSNSSSASRFASARETRALLESAIGRLPAIYQQVVRLCDLEERPTQEVATQLGRSVGAVKMLRVRAHDHLRELLGSQASSLLSRA